MPSDNAPDLSDFATQPIFAGLPGDIRVSFEVFPPKTDAGEDKMLDAVKTLATLGPDFVSVTYGAGGSTRERSKAICERIAAEADVPVAAHLTCVNASKEETLEVADGLWNAGIRHIVALRGDMPNSDGALDVPFQAHPDGYGCAAELVEGLAGLHPFEISVSAYPEVHPEARCADEALDYLKRKLDAGASRAITQFFFSTDAFLRFRDCAAAAGIDKPIVPGILPVTDLARTRKMASECGAEVPDWIADLFEGLDDQPQARELVSSTVNAEFCRRLYAEGVRDYHFYTLNKSKLAYATCHMLGLRPVKPNKQEKAA
ncbi:methylenetetrahydrofolate reductase [NAD(P)H] [Paraurantiacibacter namhicola]|uniref:Methylenetetrahydrofolate reductase n=1 Tax=Paraurantiacibacter namhicola TaxID=645517 RepID=A0A1C7DAE6_9SPHN|nr:methylenetetrahydrofolate reductase [NAD(P)H] [Paraurantiacibacter namhicola]ANU08342.1 5,10-methylenetetrahydrofolate reductase [Paraurantiacibacter namhicola]